MFEEQKRILKSISNIHRPDDSPNVFLFSSPRSGSTWLMELIWSQPGFKPCDEPLNLRNRFVQRYLGLSEWEELYNDATYDRFSSYFQGFCSGRLRFMNPNPLRKYYRPMTHRIVFKIIHGGEDRISWFRDTFNGRIVFLLRHPIAVSLSRETYPRIEAFLRSDYSRNFTKDQIEYAREILEMGTDLERGVLSWCLQNWVPLRDAEDDWAIVSYEQLVLEPYPVIMQLAKKLNLPMPERILSLLTVPSAVLAKSDHETQQILESKAGERSWLVEKWRTKVDEAEEKGVMDILKRFQLDIYTSGSNLPNDRFWINP